MRKERKELENKRKKGKALVKEDIFVPYKMSDLGSDNDPCFGKLYDLSTPECRRCGDSEFCVMKMAQNLNVKRSEIEAKKGFKDIEDNKDTSYIKKYMRGLMRKGETRKTVVAKSKAKFEITSKEARTIYKTLKS